jgi:hypothetical protein
MVMRTSKIYLIGYLREMKNAGKIFVVKSHGKRLLTKFGLRWEKSIGTFSSKIRVIYLFI